MTLYDNEPPSKIRTAQQAALEDLRRQVRAAALRRVTVEALWGERPMAIPNLFRNPAATR
jgi:hypothetical protein